MEGAREQGDRLFRGGGGERDRGRRNIMTEIKVEMATMTTHVLNVLQLKE